MIMIWNDSNQGVVVICLGRYGWIMIRDLEVVESDWKKWIVIGKYL